MEITVAICAYNEEKNLPTLINQILSQSIRVNEIIVVSSGSTDNTDKIVKTFAKKDKRIKLIRESTRKGKVSAVRLAISNSTGDIILLCSADVQLKKETFKELVKKFTNQIGMVGSHPIPTNNPNTFVGFYAHLLWKLHHEISLRKPKCGELIAFRNSGCSIPPDVPIDEAYLESKFVSDGYGIAYAPKAIVYNHGPDTIAEFIKQRRRIHSQHFFIKKHMGYSVSTADLMLIGQMLMNEAIANPISFPFIVGAVLIEGFSFALGAYDFYIQKNAHPIWDVTPTTKSV